MTIKATIVGRLGRDAELKYLQTGTAVTNLNVCYNVGWGENKIAQWISLSIFGKKAESMCQHLTSGKQFVFFVKDIKNREYQKNEGGVGYVLEGVIEDLTFCSDSNQNQQPQQQAPQQQHQPQTPQQQHNQQDIPF